MNDSQVQPTNDVAVVTQEAQEETKQPVQKEIFRTKRSYIPVELDKRQKLIKAVEEEGLTIKEAAQNFKINYSTAKHIVKVYKRTGEIQTQMMQKRLPERDISSLEALAFRQASIYRPDQTNMSVYNRDTPYDFSQQYKRLQLDNGQSQMINTTMLPNGIQYGQIIPNQPLLMSNFIRQQVQPINMTIQQNDPQILKPVPVIKYQQPQYIPQQQVLLQQQPNLNLNQIQFQNQSFAPQGAPNPYFLMGLQNNNYHYINQLR